MSPAKAITPSARRGRRGVVIVLSAVLMVVLLAMAALAIDVGYMYVVRTQLQAAADAGALAAGNSLHLTPSEVIAVGTDYVTRHDAGGRKILASETNVELGIWDVDTETFTPMGSGLGNAVRVTAGRNDEALFFAKVMGTNEFTTDATAIAMANPKDIVIVVDASGSMNDDTEPAWATTTVNSAFAGAGIGAIGDTLMNAVYDDFNFGSFPGTLQYLGAPLGVAQGSMAYADMTSDIGPLASSSMPSQYRIVAGDDEQTRRVKSYSWIIDNQIRNLLPDAVPAPTTSNFGYWEKYIDYVLLSSFVQAPVPPPSDDGDDDDSSSGDGGGGSSGGDGSSGGSGGGGGGSPPPPPAPTPPIGRLIPRPQLERWIDSPAGVVALIGAERYGFGVGTPLLFTSQVYGAAASGPGLPRVGGLYGGYSAHLPPNQDGDRINQFNNPNTSSFPSADGNLPNQLRNFFGKLTYLQFLMDYGRDLRPDGSTHVELSVDSGNAPMHSETVAGRSFQFPPREQPMHAVRRSVIRSIDVLEQRNGAIPSAVHRDRVGVVRFDTTAGSVILQDLTANYTQAMNSVTDLQAVGDKATTTATESGLKLAQQMLKPASAGGQAREDATKVTVLLTDGIPNAFESAPADINNFASANPNPDFYGGGFHWLDAALMKAMQLKGAKVDLFPVGIGLGTDYDFMDRVARAGGTANSSGQSPKGSGNPAEYEQRLVEIFEKIIRKPVAKLVQ